MWTTNGLVIVKKTKDEYECAPIDLSVRQNALFEAVKRLNVSECNENMATRASLTTPVCNACQHHRSQVVFARREPDAYAVRL
jgi:hypothetical protein